MDSRTLERIQKLGRFVELPNSYEQAPCGWWLVEDSCGFRWWLHESGRKILSAKHWDLTEKQIKEAA